MTVSPFRIHRIATLMVLAMAVVLLLAAAFAACGGGHSATDDVSGLPPEGPFFELMNLIPLNEDSRAFVSFNDYTLAREANGIQAPAEDASDEDLEEYLFELWSLHTPTGLAEGPWISGFTQYGIRQLEHRAYLSFDMGNLEQSILAGEPPFILEAASGRFDPEATESSLSRCAECDEPEIHEHSGINPAVPIIVVLKRTLLERHVHTAAYSVAAMLLILGFVVVYFSRNARWAAIQAELEDISYPIDTKNLGIHGRLGLKAVDHDDCSQSLGWFNPPRAG